MLVALSASRAEAQRTVALEWLGASATIDPLYSYVPIAKEMGYLTSNGIAIDLTVTPMNGITIPPVVAGRAPVGYGAAEQLIGPAADGQDPGLTFFFNLNREPIFNVVVLPQSPIKTFRDLKGTTVGSRLSSAAPCLTSRACSRRWASIPTRMSSSARWASAPARLPNCSATTCNPWCRPTR
jgi:ABC-type nitrate/sulfonate/bicarbonate transport system substrate-binding protein